MPEIKKYNIKVKNENVNIIDYLNNNNIKWFPINLSVNTKTLTKKLIPFEPYKQDSNDFKNLTDEQIKWRQQFITETDYIAIDTNKIQQLDIDNPELLQNDEIFNLRKYTSFYLSVSKKLEHFFVEYNNDNTDRIAFNGADLLTGSWSWCNKNIEVHNSGMGPHAITDEFLLKNFNKVIDTNNNEPIKKINIIDKQIISNVDNKDLEKIENVLKNIDEKYYNEGYKWLLIGSYCYFKTNGDNSGFELWKKYSKLINECKYKDEDWTDGGIAKKHYFYGKHNIDKIDIVDKWYNKKMKDEQKLNEKLLKEKNKNDFMINNKITYENLKIEFEKKYFFIQSNSKYGYIDFKGDLIIKDKKHIINSNEGLQYKIYDEKKDKIIDKDFIYSWFKDNNKRFYDDIGFSFIDDLPNNIYNQFNGLYVNKIKFNDDFNNDFDYTINKILNYIKTLFNNKDDYVEYFLNWVSYKLQNLNEPIKVALLLKSTTEGTGKGKLCDFLGRIVGLQYYNKTDKIDTIFGRFNSGMCDKLLVVLDEINNSRVKDYEENIKSRITEDYITKEDKGLTAIGNYKNTASFIFLTNNDFPLKISQTDRRFCILDCTEKVQSNEYYEEYIEFFKNDKTIYCFYKYLMNKDISKFNIKDDRPKSQLADDIKEASKPIIYNFIEYLATEVEYDEYNSVLDYCFNKDDKYNCAIINGCDLYKIYKKWLYFNYGNKIESNNTRFGLDIKKFISYTITIDNDERLYIKEYNTKGIIKYKKKSIKYYIDFELLYKSNSWES